MLVLRPHSDLLSQNPGVGGSPAVCFFSKNSRWFWVCQVLRTPGAWTSSPPKCEGGRTVTNSRPCRSHTVCKFLLLGGSLCLQLLNICCRCILLWPIECGGNGECDFHTAHFSPTSVSLHLSVSVSFSVSPFSSAHPCHTHETSLGWTLTRQGAELFV